MKKQTYVWALTGLLCFGVRAEKLWAQDRPPPPEAHHRPPQAMIDACVNKAAGDACSAVRAQDRNVAGSCFAPADVPGARLACRPAGGLGSDQHDAAHPYNSGPPAQSAAIAATQVNTNAVLCTLNSKTRNVGLNLPSTFAWNCANGLRNVLGNGIPSHAVGAFPNAANPNKITPQSVQFTVTLTPVLHQGEAARVKESGMAINGITFDPGTGGSCPSGIKSAKECTMDRGPGQWRMEALGQSSFNFGMDANNAHVQPDGGYHYHGLPTGLLSADAAAGRTMQLIGWASDGYPMYALFGHSDEHSAASSLRKMRGSYRIKITPDAGRPAPILVPMGTFVQDYEYAAGSGDLDECNGRQGVTPEFPKGTYHYYVTDTYPYVQRCVKGTPNASAMGEHPPAGLAP
jgi:hypothetical protein